MYPVILNINYRHEALKYLRSLPANRDDNDYIEALIKSLENISDEEFINRLPATRIAATKAVIEQLSKFPPNLNINDE